MKPRHSLLTLQHCKIVLLYDWFTVSFVAEAVFIYKKTLMCLAQCFLLTVSKE